MFWHLWRLYVACICMGMLNFPGIFSPRSILALGVYAAHTILAFGRLRWTGHPLGFYQLPIDNFKYDPTNLVFKCFPSWILENAVASLFLMELVLKHIFMFGTEENMLDLVISWCSIWIYHCGPGKEWSLVEQKKSGICGKKSGAALFQAWA